jgi:hypothetical protein
MHSYVKQVGNDTVTQQQAELIETCFNKVMCCLMPHPGEKVSKNLKFQGHLQGMYRLHYKI